MSETTITVECPSCGATLRSRAATSAARVVKCPRCSNRFSLAAASEDGVAEVTPLNERTVPTPRTQVGKGRTAPAIKGVPEGEAIPLGRRNPAAKSARPRPVDPLEGEDDDLDEVDSYGPGRRPRRHKNRRGDSSKTIALIVAGVVLLLAVGGGITGVVLLVNREKKDTASTKDTSAQVNTPSTNPTFDKPKVEEKPAPEDKTPKGKDKPEPTATPMPITPEVTVRRLVPPPLTEPPVAGMEVNNLAPDIVGVDLNGKKLKLSDYRGKVVLLDFWGDWCPYCRECYPHEKEMVSKLAGRPFVMLGVNTDRSAAEAKVVVAREQLNWASWTDSPLAGSPITKAWNIESFPTVYLIDHNGIIRRKLVGFSQPAMIRLAQEAEELVQDAEKDKR